MSLQVKGKITKILDVEKGESKAGKEWQKINFVVDTGAEFNPEVCFQIFGEEKVNNFTQYNKVGSDVEVSFNVSSREYNGKYYHNLDAWKVWGVKEETQEATPVAQEAADDLPF